MSGHAPSGSVSFEPLVRRCLGARVVRVEPVAPGLGTRRFYRLGLAGGDAAPGSVIARVDAPEDPTRRPSGVAPEPPLEPIRRFLEEAGLPVPARYGRDEAAGIELLEDVGDTSLEDVVRTATGDERRRLYAEVARWVARLQALEPPATGVAAFERCLDDAQIAYKAERLIRWGLPELLGRAPTEGEAKVVREGFARIADVVRSAPKRLAHRDLKAANIHVRPARSAGGPPEIALIDLQGAFLAPPEYDLVCLFHDAQVDLPLSEIDAQLAAARPLLPDAPCPDDFARRFHLLTLSRVGKDVSLFLYAARELGDERYLGFVPRAVRILRGSAARAARLDPELGELARLLGRLEDAPCGR
ncbi:MAG: phosphotransferase family protein [Myxococcota bacterium]